MAAPTVRAVGSVSGSATSTMNVSAPAGTVVGDLLICFAETDIAGALNAPSGWSEGYWVATVANVNSTKFGWFWKIATGSDTAAFTGGTDHLIGRMIGITTGTFTVDPGIQINSGVEEVGDTTGSIPGPTTLVDECLVLVGVAIGADTAGNTTTAFSAWTNANLGSLTERMDDHRLHGNGGGIGMASGVMASAGDVGVTTVTTPSSWKAYLSLAIEPPTAVVESLRRGVSRGRLAPIEASVR